MSDYSNKQAASGLMTSFDPGALNPPPHTLERLVALERDHGAPNHPVLPVVVARGRGSWVQDTDGVRYLDFLSSHFALNQGHRHPHIIAALKAQVDRLTLTAQAVHHDQLGPFLAKLTELTGLGAVLPQSTGSEAVALGLRTVRQWAFQAKGVRIDESEIVVASGGCHGRMMAMGMLDSGDPEQTDLPPSTSGFRMIPYGDSAALEAAITPNTAAFLLEPIQTEGAIVLPPDGYLARVREICDAHKVLLFVDELQSGLGRTGTMFAYEHAGIRPDCMTIGQSLGGGVYPVSAFLADRPIMDVLEPGAQATTYGGNPLAGAVGIAAIEVIENEDLVGKSRDLGEKLATAIREMDSPHVVDVRGSGLLVGIEIETRSGPAQTFCDALLKRHVLTQATHEQVIRLAPPLNIEDIDLEWAISNIGEVLS